MLGVKVTILKVVLVFSPEPWTAPEFIQIRSFKYPVLKTFLMMRVKTIELKYKRYSNPDPKPKPEPVLKTVLTIIVDLVPFFSPVP